MAWGIAARPNSAARAWGLGEFVQDGADQVVGDQPRGDGVGHGERSGGAPVQLDGAERGGAGVQREREGRGRACLGGLAGEPGPAGEGVDLGQVGDQDGGAVSVGVDAGSFAEGELQVIECCDDRVGRVHQQGGVGPGVDPDRRPVHGQQPQEGAGQFPDPRVVGVERGAVLTVHVLSVASTPSPPALFSGVDELMCVPRAGPLGLGSLVASRTEGVPCRRPRGQAKAGEAGDRQAT